jgi:hypothetical protein
MTWIAIALALASLGLSWRTIRRNGTIMLALEAEKRENDELKTTLVEVLDEEGNIRGQLALPGQRVDQKVSHRLALAERSVSTIQEEIKEQTKKLKEEVKQASAELLEASGALEAAQSREKMLVQTLAEVVDGDGEVLAQLRLPGKKGVSPNKTPCGDMCKLAFREKIYNRYGEWHGKMGEWACMAGQGRPCDNVRKQFEDADGQCVLWERDSDC